MHNFIAKYEILKENIYNFDETGFLMDQIDTIMVITSSNRIKNPKLAQPGNHKYVIAIIRVNS